MKTIQRNFMYNPKILHTHRKSDIYIQIYKIAVNKDKLTCGKAFLKVFFGFIHELSILLLLLFNCDLDSRT